MENIFVSAGSLSIYGEWQHLQLADSARSCGYKNRQGKGCGRCGLLGRV